MQSTSISIELGECIKFKNVFCLIYIHIVLPQSEAATTNFFTSARTAATIRGRHHDLLRYRTWMGYLGVMYLASVALT